MNRNSSDNDWLGSLKPINYSDKHYASPFVMPEKRSRASSAVLLNSKDPLDHLDRLTVDELRDLKGASPLMNKDSVTEEFMRNFENAVKDSIENPLANKNSVVDKNLRLDKEMAIIKAFYGFNIANETNVAPFKFEIINDEEEEALFKSHDVNNFIENVMLPLPSRIKYKTYKVQVTPFQQREKDTEKKSTQSITSLSSQAKQKQELQDFIACTYHNHDYLLLYEFIFLMESRGCLLQKFVILTSVQPLLVVFYFNLPKDTMFHFVIAFRMTLKGGASSKVNQFPPLDSNILHFYREDVVPNAEEDDDDENFFINYTIIHNKKPSSSSDEETKKQTLFDGTEIGEPLYKNILLSFINYVHYGYTFALPF